MESAQQFSHSTVRNRLEQWASKGHLFALVDSFFELPAGCEKQRLDTRDTDPMFYDLIAWDQVTYQAPYLVRVNPSVLDWLSNGLSTERWGIFVASQSGLDALAKHFQKFVIARGPDGNPYFLRFQDAAVLDVLLKTWDPKERSVFFGPAQALGLPDLDSMEVQLAEAPSQMTRAFQTLPEDCLISLRESQLKLCGEAIDRDLVKVIYWHLRNHHARAVQFIDKITLDERIQFSIIRARRYGLNAISDLAGFSALMFELAPNFDDHPSFKKVLLNPEIPADTKMRYLSQSIGEREWGEAIQAYDRNSWPAMTSNKTASQNTSPKTTDKPDKLKRAK